MRSLIILSLTILAVACAHKGPRPPANTARQVAANAGGTFEGTIPATSILGVGIDNQTASTKCVKGKKFSDVAAVADSELYLYNCYTSVFVAIKVNIPGVTDRLTGIYGYEANGITSAYDISNPESSAGAAKELASIHEENLKGVHGTFENMKNGCMGAEVDFRTYMGVHGEGQMLDMDASNVLTKGLCFARVIYKRSKDHVVHNYKQATTITKQATKKTDQASREFQEWMHDTYTSAEDTATRASNATRAKVDGWLSGAKKWIKK